MFMERLHIFDLKKDLAKFGRRSLLFQVSFVEIDTIRKFNFNTYK